MADTLNEFATRVRGFFDTYAQRRRVDEDPMASIFMDHHDEEGMVSDAKEFQALLFDAGLAGITWPIEYGGHGLTIREQVVFNEIAAEYEVPTGQVFTVGFGMCGPTILAHGTDDHRHRYLRPMLRGDEIWCQLFTEPGAGSDVASSQTRAVRVGTEYVVNGQKVWTSGAHYSDFGILLARTHPSQPKHRGLSMFIVDMRAPGITCRPIRQMTGGAHFNEVFFDDVRVPETSLLGGEGQGWRVAITTLMNERVALGSGQRLDVAASATELARAHSRSRDPVIRQRIADTWIRQQIVSLLGQRIRASLMAGQLPGPEGSVVKLASTSLGGSVSELLLAISGPASVAWEANDPDGASHAQRFLAAPAGSIAGGTDEVQRNIIGERVLGLPKEPQVDRDVPFNQTPTAV